MKKQLLRTKKQAQREQNLKNKPESKNELNLTCDNCQEPFQMKQSDIKSERIELDTEWRYFACPKCNKRYTTYIGNSKVENLINKRNNLKDGIRKEIAKGEFMNQKRYLALIGKDNETAKQIKKIQTRLKEVNSIEAKENERILESSGESSKN